MPKPISSLCPSGCSDRILTQQQRGMLEAEKQKRHSCVVASHQRSARTQRTRPEGLFTASCLIFFYYYVQKFFYTKKLNAVLINSVCRIGVVPKVAILCRISTNFFFFFWENSSIEMVDSLCPQWNRTPWQLVDYKSNIYQISIPFYLFYFMPKGELHLFEIGDNHFPFGVSVYISSHPLWTSHYI